ncbi:MAG: PilZ domain-containing protein [Proteobacteria bacterium]|nr:PilZ domain-containing protein [Pseudomonadota bacterium]
MGHVVDISMKGIMILTKEKIDEGGLFRLEIVLPEELEGRDRLNIRAKSMWCKRDANPDYYVVGLELEDMSMMDEEILMDYIRQYGY